MLKGFKDFLMKGNVLDLAVAVVMGAAFTAIVKAFTDNIVQPLIASIGGGPDTAGLAWTIRAGNKATELNLGAVITAAINFVLIAAVIYFLLVMPYEHMKARFAREGDDAGAATEAELLVEIRDLLATPPESRPRHRAGNG
ncbi:large conductance mechanosensitive channel protein MscL [Tsukamurella sp. 8F]|uniref:large conductance mechanosensitive channel protein MscL n=1 Tax=unclassified Tsukamurella TaxID=2633480 RepID=UPI0023B99FBF|nr:MULTISPECIES: large conductance mechanosensitive channel protein MscL [unclassified Tsukamurella]MDF0530326.1 large conductance mechanosensitive channel protein MscL [Tsukamurella sp. 8J]MDF0587623.1 large conductance mechanosensitive channel protein MscL [Tsukamurella sp. 8F]